MSTLKGSPPLAKLGVQGVPRILAQRSTFHALLGERVATSATSLHVAISIIDQRTVASQSWRRRVAEDTQYARTLGSLTLLRGNKEKVVHFTSSACFLSQFVTSRYSVGDAQFSVRSVS